MGAGDPGRRLGRPAWPVEGHDAAAVRRHRQGLVVGRTCGGPARSKDRHDHASRYRHRTVEGLWPRMVRTDRLPKHARSSARGFGPACGWAGTGHRIANEIRHRFAGTRPAILSRRPASRRHAEYGRQPLQPFGHLPLRPFAGRRHGDRDQSTGQEGQFHRPSRAARRDRVRGRHPAAAPRRRHPGRQGWAGRNGPRVSCCIPPTTSSTIRPCRSTTTSR